MPHSPTYILIGDSNTIQKVYKSPTFKDIIHSHLPDFNINCPVFEIKPGEKHKTLTTLESIWTFLVDQHATRITKLIALGGGVVSDIVGFAAATYFRGIPWIAIPTSLLAMVDATVGGKTAIDFNGIKNQIGAFHEPIMRIVDTRFLQTLPKREWSNGMAESIKIAITSNPNLWKLLMTHNLSTIMNNNTLIQQIVYDSIDTKKQIVEEDLHDKKGIRDILNFGHTVGHAVESLTNMPHGEAVSLGILRECKIGTCSFQIRQQIRMVLEKYGLPTEWKAEYSIRKEELLQLIQHDKKGTKVISIQNIGIPYIIEAPTQEQLSIMLDQGGQIKQSNKQSNKDKSISLTLPSSKSETNRAFILSAIGRGNTKLYNPLICEDTLYMINALQQCGVGFDMDSLDENNYITVYGIHRILRTTQKKIILHVGQSGTCFRFLIGFLCGLRYQPSLTHTKDTQRSQSIEIIVSGHSSLRKRPIQPLIDALRQSGHDIETNDDQEVCIQIPSFHKKFSKKMVLQGNISSQFISSLLMSCHNTIIETPSDPVSQSYIDLTIHCMKHFHRPVLITKDNDTIQYHLEDALENPSEYTIEMDATSAVYPVVWSYLTGKKILITNWLPNNKQGDSPLLVRVMKTFGISIKFENKGATCDCREILSINPYVNDNIILDMDSSDTFMTIALLATKLKKGLSITISNIENQNVKESSRIDAIVEALQSCGISADYREGYLTIQSGPVHQAKTILPCYHDHRLAMTYAMMGHDNILDNIECVEKTFPDYFTHIASLFGCHIQKDVAKDTSYHIPFKQIIQNTPIILIGMPNSGKTYIGKHISKLFDRRWYDTDNILLKTLDTNNLTEWIKTHGWNAFRKAEFQALQEAIHHHQSDDPIVISTGGGIIEYKPSQELLQQNAFVVWIDRNIQELSTDYSQHTYGISLDQLHKKRKPLYQSCCSHRLYNTNLSFVDAWFTKILESNRACIRPWGSFLCIGSKNINAVIQDKHYQGCDCIEYRPDLTTFDIQLDFPPKASILFTYKNSDDISNQGICEIQTSIQEGVQWIDLELHWSKTIPVHQRKQAFVIGSCHCECFEELKTIIEKGVPFHQPDILKIVCSHTDYHSMVSWANREFPNIIKILLASGENGIWSRVENKWLTPVYHPDLLPTATGQYTLKELTTLRSLAIPKHSHFAKHYFLIGDPILESPGYKYHNQLFSENTDSHPRVYRAFTATNIEQVSQLKQQGFFSGASVTCPLKEKVSSLCDWISKDAKEIGAINTIICHYTPDQKPFWKGYNTDWIAVREILERHCCSIKKSNTIAIIGTGGMARACAYACHKIQQNYWVIGRNEDKRAELSQAFSSGKGHLPWDQLSNHQFDAILICVSMDVPIDLRSQSNNTVIVEMSYKKNTKHAYPIDNQNIISGMDIFEIQAKQQQDLFRLC